MKFGFEAV